ncbi:MAG: ribonuclease HII [Oscillospiraceae bacterium]|nr:ribonuclease HII [Oscillospiraceae bacterium]
MNSELPNWAEFRWKGLKIMNDLFLYDKAIKADFPLLCGVDEAGRGPLCGPVCCAAVILKDDFCCDEINDSKKISEKKREKLFDIIIENCVSYSIVFVEPHIIDDINILNASLLGMKQAVKQLNLTPNMVIVDGNKVPPQMEIETKAVVKGDAKSLSIAAASILAKVSRDRYMQNLHEQYPQYRLDKHKGYPTKLHYEMLAEYGIQDFYRRSFLKNRPELLK